MENTKAMSIQMPEETHRGVEDYLKRHKTSQKDFVTGLLQQALEQKGGSTDPPDGA